MEPSIADGPTARSAVTRATLRTAPREYLHRGSWIKADLLRVATPDGPVVVKDFGAKSAPVRLLGRLQITRECAAYAVLAGLQGILRCLGRIDAHALVLEYVEGVQLHRLKKHPSGPELLAALRAVLDSVHARGVIHNDLRGKDNALLRNDGGVVLIDFAGAFVFRPGSLAHRFLFRRLSRVDEAAYLKWKKILDPGSITPEEERFLRRFALFRRLWIFNPKGALGQR